MTLRDDLERVATALRSVTKHPVEVIIEGDQRDVYVNFGYHEALVINCQLVVGSGLEWHLTAYAWDQTGGVSDEHWIGHVREEYVHSVAKIFLDEQDRHADEVERLFHDFTEGP